MNEKTNTPENSANTNVADANVATPATVDANTPASNDAIPEFDYNWSVKDKIDYLVKWRGAIVVKGIKLEQIEAKKEPNRVSLKAYTDKAVPAIANVAGTAKVIQSHVLFTSSINMDRFLRKNERVARFINFMNKHYLYYEDVLNHATVDAIFIPVKANDSFIDPFTTSINPVESPIKNDSFIPTVVAVNGLGEYVGDILREMREAMRTERELQEQKTAMDENPIF